jgi:hypothetical protein
LVFARFAGIFGCSMFLVLLGIGAVAACWRGILAGGVRWPS